MGPHTVNVGRDRPDGKTLTGVAPDAKGTATPLKVAVPE
jgi:hypothetical protein